MAKTTTLLVNGERFSVEVLELRKDRVSFALDGRTYEVEFEKALPDYSAPKTASIPTEASAAPVVAPEQIQSGEDGVVVCAPIPGVVIEVVVKVGQTVKSGEILLRVEAMKMENNIFAPCDGEITKIAVSKDEEISDGQGLIWIDQIE